MSKQSGYGNRRKEAPRPPSFSGTRGQTLPGQVLGLRSRPRAEDGQTLVEFALVSMLFLLLTVGMIDGVRVIFYYSQIQEAARQGARWGSVQVARAIMAPTNGAAPTVGGTFYDPGNAPTTYTDSCSSDTSSAPVPSSPPPACYPLSSTGAITDPVTGVITPTIVGATMRATTALNPADAQIVISTTAAISDTSELTMTENTQTDVNWFTNKPVTVTVTYPFHPLLSLIFKKLTIPLKGTSVMLHE